MDVDTDPITNRSSTSAVTNNNVASQVPSKHTESAMSAVIPEKNNVGKESGEEGPDKQITAYNVNTKAEAVSESSIIYENHVPTAIVDSSETNSAQTARPPPQDNSGYAQEISKGVTKPRYDSTVPIDNSSENGEEMVTKEKLLPKVKQVSKCCYCERDSAESLKTVPCLDCGSRCHIDCIKCTANFNNKILLGDDFFHFKCFKCTNGHERFKRYHLSWVDVVHITLFNLTHNPPIRPNGISSTNGGRSDDPAGQFSSSEHGPQEYGDSRIYFHYKADVAKFIDQHWSYFWTKSRGETWINSASSALSTNSTENVPEDGRFESGKAKYNKNGMWALTDDLRLPSSYDSLQQQKTRTIMYSFSEDGSLIELRTQSSGGRRKRRADTASKTQGRAKKNKFNAPLSNTLVNPEFSSRRVSRGKRENQKSSWSVEMWPDIDNPQGPAHMSREETHAAVQFVIESDRLTVWNDKGYRMAKASHGVETGAWYFEAEIMEPVRPEFNLRIGWSQISGELQAPCGFDVFSYSMRAKPSTRFHAAIGSPYGEDYGPGDTLGMLIYLPPLDADEHLDLEDRKWKIGERYRKFKYSRPEAQRPTNADPELPPLPVLSGSELVYFKNGKCLGPAFQKLYLGKYYPAVSSYMGGKVKISFGPNFKYPPPSTWRDNTPIRPISDLEHSPPLPQQSKPLAQLQQEQPQSLDQKQEQSQKQQDQNSSKVQPLHIGMIHDSSQVSKVQTDLQKEQTMTNTKPIVDDSKEVEGTAVPDNTTQSTTNADIVAPLVENVATLDNNTEPSK